MKRLVGRLSAGPLDIFGDVHGELDALEALAERLGYARDGTHSAGRRMVFVGDLCDRGPDSPEVIRRVQGWVEEGRAQAIVGNHELNLLRRERKHGNHWFYQQTSHPEFGLAKTIVQSEQNEILEFFRTLPVALEREDLRIVHAAWIETAVERCREYEGPVDQAYAHFQSRLEADAEFRHLKAEYEEESRDLGPLLSNAPMPPQAHAIGPYEERCQMGNPIRVLTSGVERVTSRPFHAAGKWRYVERVPWWREYASSIPVVFGHYWRWWDPGVHPTLSKGEPQLFPDDVRGPTMSPADRAFCVDFSAGVRYKHRMRGDPKPYHGRLAALRWPERTLVFDAEDPAPWEN